MKAVLVAHDTAPSMAFEKLFYKLTRKEGMEVTTYLDYGKVFHHSFTEMADTIRKHASVVLCGMSSSEELAYPEITAAQEARKASIPFGFYADTFGCAGRVWFKDLRDSANFFLL